MFWRAVSASGFLLLFMLWRDGPQGTLALFRNMGLAGLGVACCFGIASSSFVVALQHHDGGQHPADPGGGAAVRRHPGLGGVRASA